MAQDDVALIWLVICREGSLTSFGMTVVFFEWRERNLPDVCID